MDGLLYEFYVSMPDLFVGLLADVNLQVLTVPYHAGNPISGNSTLAFHRGLVGKCDNALRQILGINEDQLTGLIQA